MLRSVKKLRGYKILATDGEIGKAYDFYFDDEKWTIRYLVVDTGSWLSGRKVLLSLVVLGQPDWESHQFPVGFTREYEAKSPDIDTKKPVSRQHEIELHQYYRRPVYWGAGLTPIIPPNSIASALEAEDKKSAEQEVNPHLRSIREVIGYHIHVTDGEIGRVEDFIVDDETWRLRYMVVNTRNWLPGRKVLVAPSWIDNVSWRESKVDVNLTQKSVKNCPKYDPSEPVNRDYEEVLHDYYGRPKYWLEEKVRWERHKSERR